ncbi:MAG: hypothetical protein ACO3U1_06440 [Marivivens sp.]
MSAAMTPNLPSLQRSGPAPADSLVLAAGLIIVSGAALGLVAVSRLAEGNLPLSYGLWVALSGAVGAWAGLAASWQDFGWPGLRGAFRALVGGLKFSLTAAVAGGTMVLPVFGTMFAPLAVFVTLLAVPAASVGLLATLALAHRAVRRWRRLAERGP